MASELKRLSQFEEEDWDSLLESIQQGDVVPVCGPELLVFDEGGRIIPFYLKVILELAKPWGISLKEGETLVDFAIRIRGINPLYDQKKLRQRITTVLSDLYSKQKHQPLLEKLTSIGAFNLFISTTPDDMLSRAIYGEAVFDSAANRDKHIPIYQFSENSRDHSDIPPILDAGKRYVYHLFGRASSGSDFAVTEDDRLKYSCLWMSSDKRPERVSHLLERKRLLVLGCGYENWQSRFFLYGLKGETLFSNPDSENMNSLFSDSRVLLDSKMDSFLSRSRGNIYFDGNASDFIDELCSRFQNFRRESKSAEAEQIPKQDEFKEKSLFISYASEDQEAAFAIKQRLTEAGWSVWLDKVKLPWGAGFENEIKRNIEGCSYFIPLFSRHSTKLDCSKNLNRYFIKEWNIARRVHEYRNSNGRFILPVKVDDCDPFIQGGCVPREWLEELHIADAPEGKLSDRDVSEIQKLMSELGLGNG